MVGINWSGVQMAWLGPDACKELYVLIPGSTWRHYSAIPGLKLEPSNNLNSRGYRTMQQLRKLGVKMVDGSAAHFLALENPTLQTGIEEASKLVEFVKIMSH